MRICVLGAGVIGLTTAWMLTEDGHDVTILDAQNHPALGASRGNGAQLSYAFVAPLASPETLRHLPAMLLDRDGPTRLRPDRDPALLAWGMRFLLACRGSAARATVAAQLQLSALSRLELERLVTALAMDFRPRTAGKLVLYRDKRDFASARGGMGEGSVALSPAECLALEPGLRLPERDLAGGIYTAAEQVGDCGAFCDELARRMSNRVAWRMGARAVPVVRDGKMVAVQANGADIAADVFVLAMGSGSKQFAQTAGVDLPIAPMKGYSLTVRPRTPEAILTHSVTDLGRKVVFAPLSRDGAPVIRIAGIADLVGNDMSIDPARMATVRRAAAAALDLDWAGETEPWTGLRPATPDSRPIVGWSGIPGLFLNTGHGALGWTLACGTARLTADLIEGRAPPVPVGLFGLRRH